MKKSLLFIFVLAGFLSACKKTTTTTPDPKTTSVILSADKTGFFSGGQDKITFSAKLPTNESVTESSDFYVDGVKIAGNTFSSNVAGEYSAYAIYDEVKSGTITFGVVDKVESPSSYTRKVLVEDYTGAWCGWCPRVAYKLEEAVKASANIIPVGVHYGDGMTYTFANQMMTKYDITGFPTAMLNRESKWNETQSALNVLLSDVARIGLGISSSKSGETLSVNVKVGFTMSTNTPLKLVVYLTEDGILEDQENYLNTTPGGAWYQAGSPIVDFEHNHVLRTALTDVFGDAIPPYVVLARNTYSTDFSIDISNYDINKLNLVAFVLSDLGGTHVYNTQIAKAGTTVDFD